MKSAALRKFSIALYSAMFALAAQAQIAFSFDFQNPGIGFNDPTYGADRQAALQSAASTLASYFTSSGPVTLTFTVNSENTNSTTLASAGSNLISGDSGFFRTVVQNKIISGVDANGPSADGVINWNWFHSWNLTSTVGAGEYDFTSTAMHELLHAFGFLSYTAGTNNAANTTWTTFDQFLSTNAGSSSPLINQTTFAWIGPDSVLIGGGTPPAFLTTGMYFSGANALAANSGNPIPIYSPAPTWLDGSSGSHMADNYFTGSNQLIMNAASDTGLGIRTLSSIEIGILADMGYTVSSVPEPATYALLFGVMTMAFVAVRRRRQLG